MLSRCQSSVNSDQIEGTSAGSRRRVMMELLLSYSSSAVMYSTHIQYINRNRVDRKRSETTTPSVFTSVAPMKESKVHVMQVMRGKSKHFYPEIAYFGQEGGKRDPPSSSGLCSPGFSEVLTPEAPSGESSARAGASSSSIFETIGASGAFVCAGTPV